jgi:hypothetical protein
MTARPFLARERLAPPTGSISIFAKVFEDQDGSTDRVVAVGLLGGNGRFLNDDIPSPNLQVVRGLLLGYLPAKLRPEWHQQTVTRQQ